MLPVRRHRPASTATPVLLGLLFIAVTIAAVVGVVYVVRQGDPLPEPTAPPKPTEAPAPRPAKVEKRERPLAVEVVGKQPPEPAKVLTFDEAWAEAEKKGRELDKAEPELTAKQLKILTVQELPQVQGYARSAGNFDPGALEAAAALRRCGLTAMLNKASRYTALRDEAFKKVAGKLWRPGSGSESLLDMMHAWGETPK